MSVKLKEQCRNAASPTLVHRGDRLASSSRTARKSKCSFRAGVFGERLTRLEVLPHGTGR